MPRSPENEPDAPLPAGAVEPALRALYESAHARFAPGLLRLFQRRAPRNPELADELAQQCWAELWRILAERRYDPGRAAISTLAYAVAHRIWLRFLDRSRQAAWPHPAASQSVVTDHADVVAHAELLEALRECVRTGVDAKRLDSIDQAIVAGVADGRSEREVATELGLAPSSVNARKQAVLAWLRRCLAAKGFRAEVIERLGGIDE